MATTKNTFEGSSLVTVLSDESTNDSEAGSSSQGNSSGMSHPASDGTSPKWSCSENPDSSSESENDKKQIPSQVVQKIINQDAEGVRPQYSPISDLEDGVQPKKKQYSERKSGNGGWRDCEGDKPQEKVGQGQGEYKPHYSPVSDIEDGAQPNISQDFEGDDDQPAENDEHGDEQKSSSSDSENTEASEAGEKQNSEEQKKSAEEEEEEEEKNLSQKIEEYNNTNTQDKVPAKGIILKVTLENFMLHNHYEIKFNERINFITGQKGSGKTAILKAIIFVLGGQPRKDYIKHDANSATVEIKIKNNFMRPYKYSLYHDSVTIIRTITKNGDVSYKTKASCGRVIAATEDDVSNILSHFSFDVKHPLSEFGKNDFVKFLNIEPRALYKLFKKCVSKEDHGEKNVKGVKLNVSNDTSEKVVDPVDYSYYEIKKLEKLFEDWIDEVKSYHHILYQQEDLVKEFQLYDDVSQNMKIMYSLKKCAEDYLTYLNHKKVDDARYRIFGVLDDEIDNKLNYLEEETRERAKNLIQKPILEIQRDELNLKIEKYRTAHFPDFLGETEQRLIAINDDLNADDSDSNINRQLNYHLAELESVKRTQGNSFDEAYAIYMAHEHAQDAVKSVLIIKYIIMEKKIGETKTTLSTLHHDLSARKARFSAYMTGRPSIIEKFMKRKRDILNQFSSNFEKVRAIFKTYMSMRKFVASIIFDHENQTAEMKFVDQPMTDGEKSFTAFAFILACAEYMGNPFFFMDGFDSFMDVEDRYLALKMIDFARERPQQYFFLTEDIDLPEDEHLTIHKLPDLEPEPKPETTKTLDFLEESPKI